MELFLDLSVLPLGSKEVHGSAGALTIIDYDQRGSIDLLDAAWMKASLVDAV